VITTMPDKFVRVTSRFPNGRSAVYFDLVRGHGFTLAVDPCHSEVSVLRMMGCYSECAARYGDTSEAEADFADLTTMLTDRHCQSLPPSPALLPSLSPSASPAGARRTGWGWKGAVAGLVIGAICAHSVTNWATTGASAVHTAALGDALLPSGPRADSDLLPPFRPLVPQQPAPSPILAAPAKPQSQPRPPAPAASFGLQQ